MNAIQTRPVAIVGGNRIPFCRQGTQYAEITSYEMLCEAMRGTVERFGLKNKVLGDVALGTVFGHPAVWNLAREAVFKSGLSPMTPAVEIGRACATSLEATVWVANKIALGKIECGIAGGVDSASDIPVFLPGKLARRFIRAAQAKSWKDRLGQISGVGFGDIKLSYPPVTERSTGKSMGQHCEMMAKEWKISRKEQDELALASHMNGAKAYANGFYKDLLSPFNGVDKDTILRGDTSIEKLGKLRPAFDRTDKGTLTAGNSSPLSDGAACVLLASEEWAKKNGLPVLAYLRDYETSAIDITQEGLLMAPAYAVAKLLQRNRMSLQEFDLYEIHEAFAAQVLCTLRAWESDDFCRRKAGVEKALGTLDRSKLNTVGSSVALGHPFAATGARIVTSLAKLLSEKGKGKGLISICTGGGMGTAAILER
jgi:acetyl-CoA C-acetyltransferase